MAVYIEGATNDDCFESKQSSYSNEKKQEDRLCNKYPELKKLRTTCLDIDAQLAKLREEMNILDWFKFTKRSRRFITMLKDREDTYIKFQVMLKLLSDS